MIEDAAGQGVTVNLSLISHTNAGKTTLARTLLGRDVGEVRDAAHVTDSATGYVLVQSSNDTLMLWDTPGFGDTARLLQRLRQAGNPIGWFLTQVWDRWRERPLWSSQQAVRNARDHADVVLYLVNAGEDPASAAYVPLEMEVLAWIGKPVVVLLNQTGAPQLDAAEQDVARWRTHIAAYADVADALPLDAFARCWVQEGELFARVQPLLPAEKRPAMARLTARWAVLGLERFHAAMAILAGGLASAGKDREVVEEGDWRDRIGAAMIGKSGERPEARRAMKALAERLTLAIHDSTDALIRLHGLSGQAVRQVLERVGDDYARNEKTPEGFSALLGGLVSGAAGGLAADLAAGGLTLGGGMIVGGILGALGAGGLARGINTVRGEDGASVRWSRDLFASLTGAALLRYLAVAHFGRGRGDWEESEYPPFWQDRVSSAVARHRTEIDAIHARLRKDDPTAKTELTALLTQIAGGLLADLYPRAASALTAVPVKSVPGAPALP